MSDAMASDPLPDTGRSRAKGRSSVGNFIALHTGDKNFARKSTRPDALNTLTAIKRANIDGKIPIIDLAPSVTPEVKDEYTLILFENPYIMIKHIITGTIEEPILATRIMPPDFLHKLCHEYGKYHRERRNYPYGDGYLRWSCTVTGRAHSDKCRRYKLQ